MEELRKLYQGLREELEAFGGRITTLEESGSRLDRRVTELERITFYGRLQFVGVSQHLEGSPGIGTAANPGIDWSSGRLLIEGQGLTAAGTLGLNVKLSDEFKAGGKLVAFTSQGNLVVDSYWGVSSPWLTNPWTGRGAVSPGSQPDNNVPFTRMVLDNFWIRHTPTNTRLTLGSFLTERVAPFVLKGPRNPNIHRPRWLPFFGADLKGDIGEDTGLKYEVFYSLLCRSSPTTGRAPPGAVCAMSSRAGTWRSLCQVVERAEPGWAASGAGTGPVALRPLHRAHRSPGAHQCLARYPHQHAPALCG